MMRPVHTITSSRAILPGGATRIHGLPDAVTPDVV